MTAAVYNFDFEQGTSLVKKLVWKDPDEEPINLVGFTARMHVRESFDDEEILIELTTENGGIVLDPLVGGIELRFVPEHTIGAFWTSARYDLEVVSGAGAVTRLLKGKFKLLREVTREEQDV
jgi:hypothetical protein